MDFIDTKTIFLILHLFGVAIGAGGAYISDIMFFSSIKDERISKTEMRFLTIGSRFVWAGLAILFISGVGLFSLDIGGYMESSKFMAKMTIVGVIVLNGIIFHRMHLPRIERHVDHHFPSSDDFMRHRPFLLISGAISFTSWTSAIILGAIRSLPYNYSSIMLVYLAILALAIISALILFKHRPVR